MVKQEKKSEKRYFEGLGRRKNSIARVRLYDEEKEPAILVNEREMEEYFPIAELKSSITAPLRASGLEKNLKVSAKVNGGGIRGQAEAIRLGISRALVKYNSDFHQTLKDLDYLKRDSRQKERKKPGLKKARRAAQWRKR